MGRNAISFDTGPNGLVPRGSVGMKVPAFLTSLSVLVATPNYPQWNGSCSVAIASMHVCAKDFPHKHS